MRVKSRTKQKILDYKKKSTTKQPKYPQKKPKFICW